MRAAVFYGPGDLRIEDVPSRDPGAGEIVVEVHAAATCGTDLKAYRRGHHKLFKSYPAPFGHEFAGVVTRVGAGVADIEPGMRVVAANTAPCGGCWACKAGRLSLCENLEFLNGAFAQEVVIPATIVRRNTYQIADTTSFASVAPLEPLATVVHGMYVSGIELGDVVAVNGAGPTGQMFIRPATLRGAHVIAVDQRPPAPEAAKKMGAKGDHRHPEHPGSTRWPPRCARSPCTARAPTWPSRPSGCCRSGSRPPSACAWAARCSAPAGGRTSRWNKARYCNDYTPSPASSTTNRCTSSAPYG